MTQNVRSQFTETLLFASNFLFVCATPGFSAGKCAR